MMDLLRFTDYNGTMNSKNECKGMYWNICIFEHILQLCRRFRN